MKSMHEHSVRLQIYCDCICLLSWTAQEALKARTRKHVRARTHAHTFSPSRVQEHTHTHACTHTHALTHARTHARTHTCTHARTHACTHAHTATHGCRTRTLAAAPPPPRADSLPPALLRWNHPAGTLTWHSDDTPHILPPLPFHHAPLLPPTLPASSPAPGPLMVRTCRGCARTLLTVHGGHSSHDCHPWLLSCTHESHQSMPLP